MIPPLDEEELNQSDLIIEGKVLGVLLVSISEDEKWKRRRYHSWVKVLKVIKGPKEPNETIIVAWTAYKYIGGEEGFIGGPSDITLYPGEEVKLYLQYNSSKGTFHAERWNAAERLKSGSGSLPARIGEVVVLE